MDFDIRKTARGAAAPAARVAAARDIRAELGQQALVDIDRLTGTPRLLARADGFLTGPSSRPAKEIALRYLRENRRLVGLSETDVSNLSLRKDYVDIAGTHHLSFVQQVGGVPLFGNGVKAHVAKDGRLIQVDGSPVRDVPAVLAAASLAPPDRKKSKKVAFYTGTAVRPAWSTVVHPKLGEMRLEVVDAQNGSLLYRKNLVQHANAEGLVWDLAPGKQRPVDLDQHGWLPAGATTLDGNVGHVAADVNGDDEFQPEEEIRRHADGTFKFPFTDFAAEVGAPCSVKYPCSWNPKKPDSWRKNREQNAVQMMYYLGTFHDHLLTAPIGFTRAAGNFEKIDGDAVQAHTLYTAGSEEPAYDNAFMGTPPDGEAPQMGMLLFRDPSDPKSPFVAGNSGDSAMIAYHEYTHGLSNRLVVDASGMSTLDSMQSGAMGEAWSDWYANDYLVDKKLRTDTPAPGEVVDSPELTAGANLFRTQPMDCPIGVQSPKCPGSPGAGPGGYTYGDMGRIGRGGVHADGEIWGQTLWELRTALGVTLARSLVTRAMELSPASPSFLDMRNSILQADTVTNGGKAHQKIWQVFAKRGMGFFAGSVTGDDLKPAEDFSMPPPADTPRGTLSGKITDADTRLPVSGVRVRISGHDSGFAGELSAVTDAAGNYRISGVIPGSYPKAYAFVPGMDGVTRPVAVRSGDNSLNWSLRRNWATTGSGASVTAFNGEDYTEFGCGPSALLEQSIVPNAGVGWTTDRVVSPAGTMAPRFAMIKLGRAVDITTLEIDPSETCGDHPSSAVKDFTVETSTDGKTWVMAAKASYTPKDRARRALPLTAGTAKVQFLRLTMLSNQLSFYPNEKCDNPNNRVSGCEYVDLAGITLRGKG